MSWQSSLRGNAFQETGGRGNIVAEKDGVTEWHRYLGENTIEEVHN